MFGDADTSWSQLGVDCNKALHELQDGSFPAIFLTLSERMYLIVCDPTADQLILADGATSADNERELVRQVIARQLASDWPAYMRTVIDAATSTSQADRS